MLGGCHFELLATGEAAAAAIVPFSGHDLEGDVGEGGEARVRDHVAHVNVVVIEADPGRRVPMVLEPPQGPVDGHAVHVREHLQPLRLVRQVELPDPVRLVRFLQLPGCLRQLLLSIGVYHVFNKAVQDNSCCVVHHFVGQPQKWHRNFILVLDIELVDARVFELGLEDLVHVLGVLLVRLPLELRQVGLDG